MSWDAAIAHSPLALALVDADTLEVKHLSDGFRELVGAGVGETRGQPLPQSVRATLATARDSGLTARATDVAYEHPAFGPVLLDCSAWPFHDSQNARDGLALQVTVQTGGTVKRERRSVLSDQIRAANAQLLRSGIRQLELAEQAHEHARRIDQLLESQAGGVLVVDASGQVVLMSPGARQLLDLPAIADPAFAERLSELDLRGKDGSVLPPEERPLQRVLTGEPFSDVELELVRGDGTTLTLAFNGSAIVDSGAAGVSLAILVFHEITPQKRARDLTADHIALISHDLRAPLNTILGYAELVQLLVRSDAGSKAADWMDRIGMAANLMASMIDDLVESTRLEAGMPQLQKEPVYLGELIQIVVAQNPSPAARDRVQLAIDADPTQVWIDRRRFVRVITNLVSNALKYSPADAPVVIRLSTAPTELVMSVTDRGSGLSPDSISRLFQRFYRVDPSSRIEGLGLGLYIARLIVEAHGGRIWAESVLGQGSTFSVAVPLQ